MYELCCVVFDGYEEQSTTWHEHNRRQTGNVSAAIIVIAENAQAHRDQPAFFQIKRMRQISLVFWQHTT